MRSSSYTLSVFSKQEHVDLLKIIAVKGNEMRSNVTPQFLMVRLHLSKRELNSRHREVNDYWMCRYDQWHVHSHITW